MLDELCENICHPEAPLSLRRIPMTFYREFIKEELKGALDAGVFSGMSDSGPTPGQEPLFKLKVEQWATLMCNIGFTSGQFRRFIHNGSSCQGLPAPQKQAKKAPQPPKTPQRQSKVKKESPFSQRHSEGYSILGGQGSAPFRIPV